MTRGECGMAHTDRELERRVINFLDRQHFPGLRTVEVEAQGGVVTIRGRVKSYHERQLCIHCCQRVAGVVTLRDEVRVESRLEPHFRPKPAKEPVFAPPALALATA
jgi:osmotically-inducible protein OsmY